MGRNLHETDPFRKRILMWRNGEPGAFDMEIDISAQVVTYIDSLIGTEDLSNGEMGAKDPKGFLFSKEEPATQPVSSQQSKK